MKIGDFVTCYETGYWQLVAVKPKIADEDYQGETAHWKKGQIIGQWAILKKAFTPKMKPRIDWTCNDVQWLSPLPAEAQQEIDRYFTEHPDYKAKFEAAPMKMPPTITNCWLDLPEAEEAAFRERLTTLPATFTMETFWKQLSPYRVYAKKPPAPYLLNLLSNPWDVDKKGNRFYFGCELVK